MFIFIKLVFFIGSLIFFGIYLIRFVLKEKKISVLLALGPASGILLYISFLNATSYFIPIQINFYLVWAVFFILGILFAYLNYRRRDGLEIDIEKKWLRISLITAIIMSLWAGLVASRGLFYDTLNPGHIPTAATIASGNFPVKNVISPDENYRYHYASDLFSAAIHKISGISVWRSYDIQIILVVFMIFFAAFGLALYLCKDFFIAYLAAIMVLYGGGLNYLHIFGGLKNLYDKFIGGHEIAGFFSFLPRMINGEIVDPVIGTVNHHWTALGFAALLVVIFMFIRLIDKSSERVAISAIIGGVLLGFLALTAETYFVLSVVALIFYVFTLFLIKRGFSGEVKRAVLVLIIFILIAVPIVCLQGGVMSLNINNGDFSKGSPMPVGGFILFGKDFNKIPFTLENQWGDGNWMPVLSWSFLKNFGLPLILFIPAFFYLRKRVVHLPLFAYWAILPIAVPIFVYYNYPHEMLRFFFPAMIFLNFILALFLGTLFVEYGGQKKIRTILYILIFLTILPGIIFEIAYTIVPLKKIEDIPHEFYYVKDFFSKEKKYTHEFFSRVPDPGKADKEAFVWIKNNTTIADIFFYPIAKPVYYDFALDMSKLKFVTFTERFSPDFSLGMNVGTLPPQELYTYTMAIKSCAIDLLKELGFNYMYVSPRWPAGLEEKCLATGKLLKVFETSDGADFRRVYKINY